MNRIIIRPQGYVAIAPIITLLLSAAGIAAFISDPQLRSDIKFVGAEALMLLLAIFVSLNYLRTRFVLLEDDIMYESLLKTVMVEYKKVETIKLNKVLHGNIHSIHFVFYLSIDTGDKKIWSPIKPYSKKSLALLASTLRDKCDNAEMDALTLSMAQGNMPRA